MYQSSKISKRINKVDSYLTEGNPTYFQNNFTKEELENEEWKTITGRSEFQGLQNYEVSNLGRIRSKRNKSLRAIRPNNRNYLKVGLWNSVSKSRKEYFVHRIVAFTFLEDYLTDKGINVEVNHKDSNKYNCRLSNLELCSRSYNKRYSNNSLDLLTSKMKYFCLQSHLYYLFDYILKLPYEQFLQVRNRLDLVNNNGEIFAVFKSLSDVQIVLGLDWHTLHKYNIGKLISLNTNVCF